MELVPSVQPPTSWDTLCYSPALAGEPESSEGIPERKAREVPNLDGHDSHDWDKFGS
jgi:hypothetical protein